MDTFSSALSVHCGAIIVDPSVRGKWVRRLDEVKHNRQEAEKKLNAHRALYPETL